MLKEIISPITYRIIKGYRDRYIMPPVNKDAFFYDAISDPNKAADIITNVINDPAPCMMSRFGFIELEAALSYRKKAPLAFLRKIYPFWVGQETKDKMQTNTGFFPTTNKALSDFSDLMFSLASEIDILTIFRPEEELMPGLCCTKIIAPYLEPFWSARPWTACLRGKKVLVIHPFAESIQQQYKRRELLFDNPDMLPEFASLKIIKAVQSIGGVCDGFNSWFDALHYMEQQIDQCDYDVALIGCGAYGMPLAAHCKRQGKKAIHLGGVLQMMFGILGKRWETEQDIYLKFTNNYWVHPLESERPLTARNVEDGCYW